MKSDDGMRLRKCSNSIIVAREMFVFFREIYGGGPEVCVLCLRECLSYGADNPKYDRVNPQGTLAADLILSRFIFAGRIFKRILGLQVLVAL